jgi:hypothetical protein
MPTGRIDPLRRPLYDVVQQHFIALYAPNRKQKTWLNKGVLRQAPIVFSKRTEWQMPRLARWLHGLWPAWKSRGRK